MNSSFTLIALGLLVSAFIESGLCLKCHQCSSYNDKRCGDPFVNDEGEVLSEDFLLDCENTDDITYTLCRKTYQNVRGDVSVIRSCGYEEYKNECYKTVLEEYNTLVCTCKEDGCNPASIAGSSMALLASSLVLAFIIRQ
eukprot:TRINITY_DN1312_c0_g1_i2.p1 TRINITY_DN1312_c0_g1~~TRINITY_DN1312_c0_g1_i2.p1  ORF type:complete len:140 (-),score=34.30 TRINITY_DN1312_c0_g1_i2:1129-1548(-)